MNLQLSAGFTQSRSLAGSIFGKGKKKVVNNKAEVAEFHRQIGKLKFENDFLATLYGLCLVGSRNSRWIAMGAS